MKGTFRSLIALALSLPLLGGLAQAADRVELEHDGTTLVTWRWHLAARSLTAWC